MGVSHPGRSCPLRLLQQSMYLPAGAMAPSEGSCAVSPICSFIRPQKLPMHALSQEQARLDMDCRIPGSWACSDAVGKARPLGRPHVSKTGLSAISAFSRALIALCLSAAFCLHSRASCILP